MPVEIPGATYGVQEEEDQSVFEPLGITYEITSHARPGRSDQPLVDYLTANQRRSRRSSGSAIWCRSIRRVFDQAGIKPGEIGRRLGRSLDTQEVLNGYVSRAVAGPAGDQLCCAPARQHGAAAFRQASMITGALYERPPRGSMTTSCPASKPQPQRRAS
jgi:simple sugar transport system substrate-binding protein